MRGKCTNIHKMATKIMSMINIEEINDVINCEIVRLIKADIISIGHYDDINNKIIFNINIVGGESKEPIVVDYNTKDNIESKVISLQKTVVINQLENKKFIRNIRVSQGNIKIATILYVPLIVKGQLVGLAVFQSKNRNAFKHYGIKSFRTLTEIIAMAYYNSANSTKLLNEIKTSEDTKLELRNMNNMLYRLVHVDSLTKLNNKRALNTYLKNNLDNFKGIDTYLTVIFIDIDCFKEYNDNYGHIKGDECIEKIANCLLQGIDIRQDFIARYGGDEFIIFMKNKDYDESNEIANRIMNKVNVLNIEHNYSTVRGSVTLSMGLTCVKVDDNVKIVDILSKADKALYKAKKQGKNKIGVVHD